MASATQDERKSVTGPRKSGATESSPAPAERLPWYRSTLGIALVGSLLMWAALPPLDLWPFAWLAPVPWLLLVRQDHLGGRRPFRALWLAGSAFWLAALYWLTLPHWATSFGWLALSFYLAFYIPVFVGLSRVAVHRLRIPLIVAAPIIWTGLELAKGHLLSGFTMGSLGHTQFRWLAFIQIADVVSGYGIGGLVIFGAACIARMIPWNGSRRAFWPLAPLAAMFAATLAYGYYRLAPVIESTTPSARVALIQGSIDITMKMDPAAAQVIHNNYMDISNRAREAAKNGGGPIDLIVWPETMFRGELISLETGFQPPPDRTLPQIEDHIRAVDGLIADTAHELGANLLLGIARWRLRADGRQDRYNSALFVTPEGRQLSHYDKMHLVMFGEYVPFADMFPFLYRFTPLPGGLQAGQEPQAEQIHSPTRNSDLRFAPNICYESTIPHVIRRQVVELAERGQEPDVLVNLTNDGWFWGSSELDLHLMCAVFRAIECRKPVLIAANTGFSAWIDSNGRIIEQGPRRAEDVIIADVQRDPRHSPYLAIGDLPSAVCLLACCGLAAVGLWDRRRRPQ